MKKQIMAKLTAAAAAAFCVFAVAAEPVSAAEPVVVDEEAVVSGNVPGEKPDAEDPTGEQIPVEIQYLYVKNDGSNGLIKKTVPVEAGTTWGEFLEIEEYKPENIITDSSAPLQGKEPIRFQRVFWPASGMAEEEIKRFNEDEDYPALLEYILYPGNYTGVHLEYEYYEGDELKDNGFSEVSKSDVLLMPSDYTLDSEEAIQYVHNNYTIYDHLKKFSDISGVTVEITVTPEEIGNPEHYMLIFRAPEAGSNQSNESNEGNKGTNNGGNNQDSGQEQAVTEPTAETIANPAKSATYVQAVHSLLMNVNQVQNSIKVGKVTADTPARVNLGQYHSLSANTMTKLGEANIDIILTYQYKGKTYTVKIPKGYQFDKDVIWYGPLYMYQLFGQNIQ